MDAIELRKAAQELRAIWVVGNEYLQAAAPWTAIKTDPARAAAITRFSLNLDPPLRRPLAPLHPRRRRRDARRPRPRATPTGRPTSPPRSRPCPAGPPFTVPPVLFAKLDDTRRAELEARFAGA